MATPTTEHDYPPIDSQGIHTFITDQGGAVTGDLQTDFRNALFIAVAPGGKVNDYSIDDLWQRHVITNISGDSNAESGNPAAAGRGKSGFVGLRPIHYYEKAFLKNPGNVNAFPGGASVTIGNDIDTFVVSPVLGTNTVVAGFSVDGGCHVNSDASRIYTCDATPDAPTQFTMSTPGDITTATAQTQGSVDSGRPFGVWLDETETKMLLTHHSASSTMHTLSTPGDTSTMSAIESSFNPNPTSTGLYNGTMNGDGTKFIAGGVGGKIIQVSLSTPYDLSTASITDTYSTAAQTSNNLYSFGIDPSGTKIFIGDQGHEIWQYDLSTAWDLTTCSYTKMVIFAGAGTESRGMSWPTGGDGTEFYLTSLSGADRLTRMVQK